MAEDIEAALREWVRPGREHYVDYAVSLLGFVSLLDIAKPVRAKPARTQLRLGRKKTKDKLLDRYVFHLEAALATLDSFTEPAIASHSSFADGTARSALVNLLNSARATDLSSRAY